ncbi:Na+/H+ antiporter subunit G [Virgibacillus sp. MSJ-26]|uniref:Na+/H+ antiporter subunit G n=1 Tax=Virgibacillus sp. MSJ-26 TaxID=2841522 RepID=UPI001C113845|nr:Na+/H+ antiporter subunit G [Virgibacillus sp. MSJ-26]MBU5466839.1 Na+/H+ antiporter subunit G [Virgibacillus sp. MSJ-26]
MNINEIDEFIAALLILIGSIISVISAFGIIRFPDVYSRAHAATKSSTLAVLLTLVGAFLFFWMTDGTVSVRLILGIVFVFITSPTAGHLIIRAAYKSNVKMTETTTVDELKELYDEQKKTDQD